MSYTEEEEMLIFEGRTCTAGFLENPAANHSFTYVNNPSSLNTAPSQKFHL